MEGSPRSRGPSKALNRSSVEENSSPSLTFGSFDNGSLPSRTPPTPRTPARYPANLSLVKPPIRKARTGPTGSGAPHEYQSLEDLLRVNGYRETRIVTPETERTTRDQVLSNSEEDEYEILPNTDEKIHPETTDPASSSSVGGRVASLFSGLLPAKPNLLAKVPPPGQSPDLRSRDLPSKVSQVDLGRRASVRSLREDQGARVPRTALTEALESALWNAQNPYPRNQSSNVHPTSSKSRPPIPYSLTSSSSASTIRPSPRQMWQQRQRREENSPLHESNLNIEANARSASVVFRPNLRHTISAPAVGRSKSLSHRKSTLGIRPTRRPLESSHANGHSTKPGNETWYDSISSMFAHVAGTQEITARNESTSQPPLSRRSTVSRRDPSGSTSSKKRPALLVTQHFNPTPAATAVSTVKPDAVLCRSAPASRSPSKPRPEMSHGKSRGRSVLKANKLMPKAELVLSTPLLSPTLALTGDDPMDQFWSNRGEQVVEDSDSDAEPPNLSTILSTHLDRTSSSSNVEDSSVTRRQRSIRSLRAHLGKRTVPSSATTTPGVDGIPPLPDLSARRTPTPTFGGAGPDVGNWVDATDDEGDQNWDRPSSRGRHAGGKKRKGLTPGWLGPTGAGS